jgi:hypothetical protein
MKNIFKTYWIYIIILLLPINLSYGQESKKETMNNGSQKVDRPDAPQIVEGDVIFSDGTNNLLRITDEGTTGAVQFQDGVPSDVTNKLYNSGGTLHFNGTALGSGGAAELNDLTDAIYTGRSIFIGEGSGINDDGSNNSNTAIGFNSLNLNTTGAENTAIGVNTLQLNTTGTYNTAVGFNALSSNIESYNTAIGYYSLNSNTSGKENTAIGSEALRDNTTGSQNIAIGETSLLNNETGNENIAIGNRALSNNLSGKNNTAIGNSAGSNALGDGNVFLGNRAGSNETGSNKLYIESGFDDINNPLIWGDFGEDSLKFNGNIEIAGNLTIAGDILSSVNIPLWLTVGNNNASTNSNNILSGKDNLSTAISTATFGENLKSSSYIATVLGRFNEDDLVYTGETWVATEPLFVIGNGTDDANRANAFMVKKNGNTSINGNLEVNGKMAIGTDANASGNNSFAIGSNINASGNGTIFLADNSASSVQNAGNDNRFAARFDNGYRFYTSSDLSSGVLMNNGDGSWSSISDSTKKENFLPVNGEEVLNKISSFNLRSWNYKGQDPAKFRHYGPMAQEFYAAFGNDGIGTVGNDTTIASADFDGINLIAIQALEKRTKKNEIRIEDQESYIKNLEERILKLESTNKDLRSKNAEYQNQNLSLINEFMEIKQVLNELLNEKENILFVEKLSKEFLIEGIKELKNISKSEMIEIGNNAKKWYLNNHSEKMIFNKLNNLILKVQK